MGVGIAIGQGHFNLDTQVISVFPNELPPQVSPNLENHAIYTRMLDEQNALYAKIYT